MLDSLTLGTLVLIACIAYGTALFHSVGGFAGGLLLMICLAPILGVKATIPVAAVAMVISNVTRVWVFRHAIDWQVFAAVFSVALPGIVLGAVLYIELPTHWVALLLSLFLLVTVPLRRYVNKHNYRVGLNGLRVAALPYGIISGTTMGAGLMLAPFLLGAGLAGVRLIAVVAALGFGLNLTKTVVFGFSPLLTTDLAFTGLLIGLCTIPGAYTGRWVVSNTPIRIHTVVVEGFILSGAAYFLWVTLTGLNT
ncbi:MAG: sulfite exporter TauE/SafE family protein [Gammaproteobacteria bacterium]|nr:sulfite exporter TauE/SafE family protein [Gammaproteobacteria bacterium]